MDFRKNLASLVLFASASMGVVAAHATTMPAVGTTYSYALTVADANLGTPLNNSYGTVTLTQELNEVDISVVLTAGYLFANSGNKHYPFVFNLGSNFAGATVAVTSFPNIFVVGSGSGPFNQTPWGDFSNAIDFKGSVGGGLSDKITGPLTLSVKATDISLNSFVANKVKGTTSYIFSADIGNAGSGRTGNVTTVANPTPMTGHVVPEPGTVALLGLGLLGAGLSLRRRR